MLDNIRFTENHVQTNASFISAGWATAGFIASRLAQEGAQGHILFEDACLQLIAMNYLLHNMGFFQGSKQGASDLKTSLERLMSSWKKHCQSITTASPPKHAPTDQYFRIMEATSLLSTCWRFKPEYYSHANAELGMVRGMSLIYPSLWLLTIHWLDRPDPVHFDRHDFAMLEITESDLIDSGCYTAVSLPYPPRLPLSSRSAPISG